MMIGSALVATWPRWRAGGLGTSTNLSTGLFSYILTTGWLHQLPLLLLTTAVFLLEVAPLELQRRVVNDVVKHRSYSAIVLLCGTYVGAVLLQRSTKLGLNIYRSWVSERARRDLRRQVGEATGGGTAASMAEAQGTVVAEVEPIGGFIGESVSEPMLQAGVLATIIAYTSFISMRGWPPRPSPCSSHSSFSYR